MSLEKAAKQHLINIRAELIRQGQWPTCTNCVHWCEVCEITDEERTYYKCGKFNMHPPEEVVVVGCIHHEKEVPF